MLALHMPDPTIHALLCFPCAPNHSPFPLHRVISKDLCVRAMGVALK